MGPWFFVFVAVLAVAVARSSPSTRALALQTMRDWGVVAAFFAAWVLSRSVADTLGMPVQEGSVIAIDRLIGFGEVPTLRLQSMIDWDAPPALWEAIFPLLYATHFYLPFGLAVTLYLRDRDRWAAFIRRWMLLSALGVTGYILLPTVPPWLASENGTVAEVGLGMQRGWDAISLGAVHDLMSFGRDTVNPIAAMPSLHAGYSALIFLFLAPRRGWFGRIVLAVYAGLMGFGIVFTGEHWVIDVIAGWACVGLAHTAATRWETRRAEQASERAASGSRDAGGGGIDMGSPGPGPAEPVPA